MRLVTLAFAFMLLVSLGVATVQAQDGSIVAFARLWNSVARVVDGAPVV